jgi:hypothetical protein
MIYMYMYSMISASLFRIKWANKIKTLNMICGHSGRTDRQTLLTSTWAAQIQTSSKRGKPRAYMH